MTRFDSATKRHPDGTVAQGASLTRRHAAANDCPSSTEEHASPC
jgi:hypothetical protein